MPQPYAFDSRSFQEMLEMMLLAWEQFDGTTAARARRPVVLHLHDADSFEAAVAGYVERSGKHRLGDGARPFHSSLYPELNEMDAAATAELAGKIRTTDEAEHFRSILADERDQERFTKTWRYLKGLTRASSAAVVQPQRNGSYLGVPQLLAPLLDPHSELLVWLHARGWWDVAGVRGPVEALQRLAGYADAQRFSDRSTVHGESEWADGKTAADLVPEHIGVVREIVDTLYNRTIVDSIGVIDPLYSTQLGQRSTSGLEFLAQRLALASADSAAEVSRPRSEEPVEELDVPELSISGAAAGSGAVLDRWRISNGVELFAALFAAMDDSSWRISEQNLSDARGSRDHRRFDEAVHERIELIARALLPRVRPPGRQGRGVGLSIAGVAVTGTVMGGTSTAMHLNWPMAAGAAGAVSATLAAAGLYVQSKLPPPGTRDLMRALGEFVTTNS